MFYKKTIAHARLKLPDFTEGSGFYLVTTPNFIDLIYFNKITAMWYYLGEAKTTPKEILDLFEDTETPKEAPGYVSESFALKAMAIAKAKSIKLTDILK